MPNFASDSMFNITRLIKHYYDNKLEIPSFIIDNTNIFETSSLALTMEYIDEDDENNRKLLNREEKSTLIENLITHLPFDAYKSLLDKHLNLNNYEVKQIIQLSLHTHNYDVLNYIIEKMMPDLTEINKTNMYSSESLFDYSRNVLDSILNFDNFRTLNNYYANDDGKIFVDIYKKALYNYEKLQKIRDHSFSLKKDWFKNSETKMPFMVRDKNKDNLIEYLISENETLPLIIEISKQYNKEKNPFLKDDKLLKAYQSGNVSLLNHCEKEYSLTLPEFNNIYLNYVNNTNKQIKHSLSENYYSDINRNSEKILKILKYSHEHLSEKEFLEADLSFVLYLKPKYITKIENIIPDIYERKINGLNYKEWITLSCYLHSFIKDNNSDIKINNNLTSNISNHMKKNFPNIEKGELNSRILEVAVNGILFNNKENSTKFQHYLMNNFIEKKESKPKTKKI